jgi:hypothetical protein
MSMKCPIHPGFVIVAEGVCLPCKCPFRDVHHEAADCPWCPWTPACDGVTQCGTHPEVFVAIGGVCPRCAWREKMLSIGILPSATPSRAG